MHSFEVTSLNKEALLKLLLDAHIGENPISIQISPDLSNSKAEDILKAIDEIYINLKISPKLPYPLFIVYPHNIQSHKFVILKNRKRALKVL